MIELKTAIMICIIHLLYYTYFQVISDLVRIGRIHNTPNIMVSRLRSKYKVNIMTFQKNSNHHGFAWFNSIYLNENLFLNPKKLEWAFHHEHYHLIHNHKRDILLMRFVFSLIPILAAFIPWVVPFMAYLAFAYLMHYVSIKQEKYANRHAILAMKK